ncbi:hypothetical protein [Sphingorhabdus sp.]
MKILKSTLISGLSALALTACSGSGPFTWSTPSPCHKVSGC